MGKWRALFLGVLAGGCVRAVVPAAPDSGSDVCPETRRTDIFEVAGSAKLDVVLVVDTEPNAKAVLESMPKRLQALIAQLVSTRGLDFHLAVAPTNLGGAYVEVALASGPLETLCTADLAIPDVTSPVDGTLTDGGVLVRAPCTDCVAYLARAQCQCGSANPTGPCANIFPAVRALMAPTPNAIGQVSALSPLQTLRAALGMVSACGVDHTTTDPPPGNAGFLREDAALLIVFVASGEDRDFAVSAGELDERYRDVLGEIRRLKGPYREDEVTVVTIAGMCKGPSCRPGGAFDEVLGVTTPDQFCDKLGGAVDAGTCGSPFTGGGANPLLPLAGCNACAGVNPPPSCDGGLRSGIIQPSPQLMALACDTGGVIYNACAADWTSVIRSRVKEHLLASDWTFGLEQAPLAGPGGAHCPGGPGLCAASITPEGTLTDLPARHLSLDAGALMVQGLVLAPGTRVRVSYDVTDPQCCRKGCAVGQACNDPNAVRGFCQAQRCGGRLGCAVDGMRCDQTRFRCLSAGTCTMDEHCATGSVCNCHTGRCVEGPAARCAP